MVKINFFSFSDSGLDRIRPDLSGVVSSFSESSFRGGMAYKAYRNKFTAFN